MLAAGLAVIAAAALAAWKFHYRIPVWFPDHGFGPISDIATIPGLVFAIGGVLALGCAADAARGRWRKALPWLVATAILLTALVVNYSRGGILLFFGGTLLWFALEAWRKRSGRLLVVGASLVLVLISIVLLSSGAVAGRFAGGADSQVGFRVLIWRRYAGLDARAAVVHSAGLKFHGAVSALPQRVGPSQQIVLHPEAIWLWLAAEMGWVGVALAAVAVVAILHAAFPLGEGSHRRLRERRYHSRQRGRAACHEHLLMSRSIGWAARSASFAGPGAGSCGMAGQLRIRGSSPSFGVSPEWRL